MFQNLNLSPKIKNSYRYGFNGMERDDEVKGEGNSYGADYRQYSSRLARWTSVDPLASIRPFESPYAGFGNNPIYYVDPSGLTPTNGGEPEKKNYSLSELESIADEYAIRAAKTSSSGKYYYGNTHFTKNSPSTGQVIKSWTYKGTPNPTGANSLMSRAQKNFFNSLSGKPLLFKVSGIDIRNSKSDYETNPLDIKPCENCDPKILWWEDFQDAFMVLDWRAKIKQYSRDIRYLDALKSGHKQVAEGTKIFMREIKGQAKGMATSYLFNEYWRVGDRTTNNTINSTKTVNSSTEYKLGNGVPNGAYFRIKDGFKFDVYKVMQVRGRSGHHVGYSNYDTVYSIDPRAAKLQFDTLFYEFRNLSGPKNPYYHITYPNGKPTKTLID